MDGDQSKPGGRWWLIAAAVLGVLGLVAYLGSVREMRRLMAILKPQEISSPSRPLAFRNSRGFSVTLLTALLTDVG